ncbi:MAG: RNA polymerase sigma factor [Bacteroidota bacterium]
MQQLPLTDEQLAIRLQSGDSDATALIYERFKSGLFLFCIRILSDADAAEDAVHETFVKMIVQRSQLNHPTSLKSWIFTIARNESFAALNRKKKIRELNDQDEDVFESEASPPMVETDERMKIVERMLDQLLPQYKEVLLLREYESMDYVEIAKVTGTTISSVKSRLFKARKAMLKKLESLKKGRAL